MKIACLCVTYNRPEQLAESIECFRRQTYPLEKRELLILDDAGQYAPDACDGVPGVKLVTTRHRFRTLGEKRNAAAALISDDVGAFAIWDIVRFNAAHSTWARENYRRKWDFGALRLGSKP